MSSEDPLAILVHEIEELASTAHDRCKSRPDRLSTSLTELEVTLASSDFDTVKWDIICLRETLKDITNELSRPESKIRSAEQAKREALATIIKSYRPLVQQLEQFATKDQGLKKKPMWRSRKNNTAALDRFHRELQFQTQTINLYLSTLTPSHLAPIKKQQENSIKGSKHGVGEASYTLQPLDRGSEADAQWSLLRRQLVEDGITDIDIEAHTSSIRALLQEKLPSYYDIHSGPSLEETNGSAEASTGLRENMLRRTSQSEHGVLRPLYEIDETGPGHGTRPSASSLSQASAPVIGDRSELARVLTKDDDRRVPRKNSADPASKLHNAQG